MDTCTCKKAKPDGKQPPTCMRCDRPISQSEDVSVDLRELLTGMIQTISDQAAVLDKLQSRLTTLEGRQAAVEGFLEQSQNETAGVEKDEEEEAEFTEEDDLDLDTYN